jgi:hypothetical protein
MSSWSARSTRIRLCASHVWPAFQSNAVRSVGTISATSTSPITMLGDLPPSSSVTGRICRALAIMTRSPVARDPVKDRWSTSGWSASAAPASAPKPVTTLRTPAGTPAAVAIRAT